MIVAKIETINAPNKEFFGIGNIVLFVNKMDIDDERKTIQSWTKREARESLFKEKWPINDICKAQKTAQISVNISPMFIFWKFPPKRKYSPINDAIIAKYVWILILDFVIRKLKNGVIIIEIEVIKALFDGVVYFKPIVWKKYAKKRKIPRIRPLKKIFFVIFTLNK